MSANRRSNVANKVKSLRIFKVHMDTNKALAARSVLPHLLMEHMLSTDVFWYILLALNFVDNLELLRFWKKPITGSEVTEFFVLFLHL